MTCLTSRPHQTIPGSVCVWWCLMSRCPVLLLLPPSLLL